MYDSIRNVGDFLSPHWLAEAFETRLKALNGEWRERTQHGKPNPVRALAGISGSYQAARAALPRSGEDGYAEALTQLHAMVLRALGFEPGVVDLETEQSGNSVTVPLIARCQSASGEALHVLQAHPVDDVDELVGDQGRLLHPIGERSSPGSEKVETVDGVLAGVQQLFLTDHAPRFVLVVAGGWMLLSDVERWNEGRYLAFDIATALARKDEKTYGELAWLAGLFSADVLLPSEEGRSLLTEFSDDSVKHAVSVSEDLREGLRTSVELIANEVISKRRAAGLSVEENDELPRELTTQALRFLYRILFLLYAEARPELAILPVGASEYEAGYGLDRLRELIDVPLTGRSAEGQHIHDSLRLLFRLVDQGNDGTHDGEGLVFEPLRADLFRPSHAELIDGVNLSNAVLQQVLALLLLSKPSRRKGARRGYVSYAQLGINQLGAVYEGLMSYSGFIADRDLVELAKDKDKPEKGTWLVPRERLGEYDEKHILEREDPITGARQHVVHPRGTFVYRLSGRDRQRSASYYTPEVLTRCVVRHALAELIGEDTPAADILEYRICEPAMGSGAFLNEALNQLAAEYLRRRQRELGTDIEMDQHQIELQKVKAYLALHRCYGVDLNDTARELAEVSLWLNTMHPGLRAPWFGLHLKRGNSLVGARRATYDLTALAKAKRSWLTTAPTDRPLSAGGIGDGEVHHFLLPADGWAAVADAKQAKELTPEKVEALKAWKREIKKKPDKKQTERLRRLARRVERLWQLSLKRLEISEREVARHIDVWGTEIPAEQHAVTREEVERKLGDPDGPYQRLRLAMDAWCAMFFWPVTTETQPPDLNGWLSMLEELLGFAGAKAPEGQLSLADSVQGFEELGELDEQEQENYFMRSSLELYTRHPWLGRVREIAQQEGFFHWELDFAQVFARGGGFDLQLGNPPWVRPTWNDDEVLAEFDPFFVLRDRIPEETFRRHRADVLAREGATDHYLRELSSWAGLNDHLGSSVEHPILAGTQTNLYTSFMERTWRSMHAAGIVGLLHPESHFTDPKAGSLRESLYKRLRLYLNFVEANRWFDGVESPSQTFALQCYGRPRSIQFRMITNIRDIRTIDESLTHDGLGAVPGTHYLDGTVDSRPHASRVISVSEDTLAQWGALFDDRQTSGSRARLVRPTTREQVDGLRRISMQKERMSDRSYTWSSGWHEKGAKREQYIEWCTAYPSSWKEVIFQGPHIDVATPISKEPNENCRGKGDYSDWDLEELPERVIPRTNYQRACDRERYDAGLSDWDGRPYTDYFRLAWRRMTQAGSERSLIAALIPPEPAHVHTVHTLAAESDHDTALIAGLWASLPYDYLVKVSGKSDLSDELIKRFPAPLEHAAAPYLLLRTLRLNCLTRDYAPLWEELYEDGFADDRWTAPFADWPRLGVAERAWTMETPLRSEFERRAALVEIDALVAIMLGLTADQLCLMYRGQFAVLRKYEYHMYFDNMGRKIAKDHHAHGVRQQKDDYKLLQAYLRDEDCGDLLDRYEEPITPVDREAEMRAAYEEFSERLGR